MDQNERGLFYHTETPYLLKIKGGELRLYRDNKKLSVSKKPWIDENGIMKIGKTVNIDLERNTGNEKLLHFLDEVKEIIQGEAPALDDPGQGA